MMTDDEIQAIKERRKPITAGQWFADDRCVFTLGGDVQVIAFPEETSNGPMPADCEAEENADFIAHAPADIDALLADNEALQARVEGLEAALGSMLERYDQGGCGITLRPCGACLWCRARKVLDGAK